MVGFQLDPSSADDRILGELIAFERANDVSVNFVTADYGARLRAKGHDLRCLVLPHELRRDDQDERAQEIRQLRERIARYEAARPELRPFLAVGDKQESFEEFNYQAEPPSAAAIDSHIARLCERHRHSPKAGDGIDRDEWAKYDLSWDAYLEHAREYLAASWSYRNRTFFLQFGAENTSEVSANNVILRLHLPDGFAVADADGYKRPVLRKPPKRPQTVYEMIFGSAQGLGTFDLGMSFPSYAGPTPKLRLSAPRIEKTNSYDIEFDSFRIPQGDKIVWDPVVIIYDDAIEPSSFAIDHWLTIGNGFGIAKGSFNVVFTKR